ncbi:hypothetical protein PG996_004887 [Apiospora saccharicola]|uniref:Uncharacterized protein n=1 Tax=Apiospora saccharicola TaxID=335842 RepID=A0ABR1VNQ9_9PEZI
MSGGPPQPKAEVPLAPPHELVCNCFLGAILDFKRRQPVANVLVHLPERISQLKAMDSFQSAMRARLNSQPAGGPTVEEPRVRRDAQAQASDDTDYWDRQHGLYGFRGGQARLQAAARLQATADTRNNRALATRPPPAGHVLPQWKKT